MTQRMIDEIRRLGGRIGRPIKLMEVCGTHTVEIFRHGIRDVIPKEISLLSGPGCPVCVTPIGDVDAAISISKMEGTILTTFGDMMRVPGSDCSLNDARAEGADVRVVYSPLDALKLAKSEQGRKVVFFATGFETTSPLIAATLSEAIRKGIGNFYIYSSHKLVPPALRALLDSPDVLVDGFMLPGHVSAIIGKGPYRFISESYGKPAVITGFEAVDILESIFMLLNQIAHGKARVENQYVKIVRDEGNPRACSMIEEYFEPVDAHWRGIGMIPLSGLDLREAYSAHDAKKVFCPYVSGCQEPEFCSCGDVLRGVKIPPECPMFGAGCTPEAPVGACMVSTEGSCAAYYRYGPYRG
jgi:hydrogenase expression/formation protein HypD